MSKIKKFFAALKKKKAHYLKGSVFKMLLVIKWIKALKSPSSSLKQTVLQKKVHKSPKKELITLH